MARKKHQYTIFKEFENLIVLNEEVSGMIIFPAIPWHIENDVAYCKIDNAQKSVTYRVSLTELGLEIEVDVTYKCEQEVENEGIQAEIIGDFGLKKDENVHVEGDAIVAGFIEDFQIGLNQVHYTGKTTGLPFGLFTDYGERQAHVTIMPDKSRKLFKSQIRKANERRYAKIALLNNEPPVRILCQPDGKDLTFTFACHPDYQSVESLRAVVYGSSDKNHPDHGNKGLSARKIKGTYGAFAKSGNGHIGILDNADMLSLYLEMQKDGFEIQPHTILPEDDTRNDAVVYLPEFYRFFNSRLWTDHHLGDGQRTIGLASLGWNKEEDNLYIMDLLEKYKYEYAWVYNAINMKNGNQLIENRFGFPFELVYQNPNIRKPNIEESFWLFVNVTYAIRNLIQSNKPEEKIDEWIEQCGVVTSHDYFGRDFFDGECYKSGTPFMITEKFDSVLKYIQQKIDQGSIWNPTMSEFCDYFIKLRNISVKVGHNKFIIMNKGRMIEGCSFLIGKGVRVIPKIENASISYKHVKRGTICWANIPTGDTVISF